MILDDDDDYLREAEEVDPPLPPEDLVELEEKNREYKEVLRGGFQGGRRNDGVSNRCCTLSR